MPPKRKSEAGDGRRSLRYRNRRRTKNRNRRRNDRRGRLAERTGSLASVLLTAGFVSLFDWNMELEWQQASMATNRCENRFEFASVGPTTVLPVVRPDLADVSGHAVGRGQWKTDVWKQHSYVRSNDRRNDRPNLTTILRPNSDADVERRPTDEKILTAFFNRPVPANPDAAYWKPFVCLNRIRNRAF